MQISRKQLRYIYNRFGFTRPSFAYYPENSATPGKRATYGEARVGLMTDGREGVLIEKGTTNLIPYSDPTDLAQIPDKGNISIAPAGSVGAAFAGGVVFGVNPDASQYAYYSNCNLQPATTYTLSVFVRMDDGGAPVPGTTGLPDLDFALVFEMGAVSASEIVNLGGGLYRVSATRVTGAATKQSVGICKYAAQSARTFRVTGFQLEIQDRKTSYMATNGAAATRSPETISVPVSFTPQQGGEISFRVDINDACKRQVAGVYPMLVYVTRANGQRGLYVNHDDVSAKFALQVFDDLDARMSVIFADSLIPNGTRELKIRQTLTAVILYCDGAEIARIDNPKLPSAWGRAYLGSSATGTDHADAMFGGIKMMAADSTVLSDILFNGPDFVRKARTIQL